MKQITKIEPSAARPTVAKIRVAAYCRVSTGTDDQLVSLETQKSHYEDIISANPDWACAGLYYDEGISGTSKEKRPALMQLIADCEAGKIDRILTKSLSRFARNTTDCLELVRRLLELGITVFFEKENLDTGAMESELLLSIMSSLAESESVSISENSKWSVRHRFENGSFKIACAPFGYDTKDGEMVINEEEAKWVRWIFDQAVNGVGSHEIARQLTENQVPTRKNGTWTATTVRGMLKNEKYIGDCLFQKIYSDFRFKRHLNHGERDQFYMENHHEAIVSREVFEAAGAMIAQRAKEKNIQKNDPRYTKRYPFTGKIICGECGSCFKRHTNSTGTSIYPVWVCKTHLDHHSECSMKSIRFPPELRPESYGKDRCEMRRGHTPYGYRIENGCAVICTEEAEQIRKMFDGYLRGLSLMTAAQEAGFQMKHSSAKRIMQNPRYLGDGFYPAIIDRKTFDAFEAERKHREEALGRDGRKKKHQEAAPAPITFRMSKATQAFSDPYRQAEYLYSLIESEV